MFINRSIVPTLKDDYCGKITARRRVVASGDAPLYGITFYFPEKIEWFGRRTNLKKISKIKRIRSSRKDFSDIIKS